MNGADGADDAIISADHAIHPTHATVLGRADTITISVDVASLRIFWFKPILCEKSVATAIGDEASTKGMKASKRMTPAQITPCMPKHKEHVEPENR